MMPDIIDLAIEAWQQCRVFVLVLLTCVALYLVVARRQSNVHPSSTTLSLAGGEKTRWDVTDEINTRASANKSPTTGNITSQTRKPRLKALKVVAGSKPSLQQRDTGSTSNIATEQTIQPLIFFSSLTGTTKVFSEQVLKDLETCAERNKQCLVQPKLLDLSEIDLDDFFVSGPKLDEVAASNTTYFYLVLLPSYDIDTNLAIFIDHLKETHHDFRIDTAPLSGLAGYSVFGTGDKEQWPDVKHGFCQQAVEVDKWMSRLTGKKRGYPLGMGDIKSDAQGALQEWTHGVSQTLLDISISGSLGDGVPGSGDAVESDEEEDKNGDSQAEEVDEFPDEKRRKRRKMGTLADLEDVGGKKSSGAPLAIDFTTYADPNVQPTFKPMVPKSSPTYSALTKQGYTIVGSHSGVKICRWTKSALRGRGSCYKNSFYGIASHLCMETTPSLSCSNKCVFCWRHGTNPVSTTWRWEIDDPEVIFNGAKQGHYQKIKMMRGVPGVRADRFEEAMRIRHCALSLVGEPIFYPRINEFLSLLHGEQISSFLVCNAQHPQQLRDLQRVTQLYVSIDASNRESLRKIDRPLHRDFWERFQSCLSILREKRFLQRTVFRLTLVKGFNMADEADGYATLVEQGLPCFVEIKGVTYCGTSTSAGAGLTMQNVPFYEEVCTFVEALNAKLKEKNIDKLDGGYGYDIAAEHAHSCCILLASKRFLINQKWHTQINYHKFFELLDNERRTGQSFTPEEYCKETEEWALWGNGGFDPRDERVDRKGRPKVLDRPMARPSTKNDGINSSTKLLNGVSQATLVEI